MDLFRWLQALVRRWKRFRLPYLQMSDRWIVMMKTQEAYKEKQYPPYV